MKVKVLNKEDNPMNIDKENVVLTSNYVSQLNKRISNRFDELKTSPIQSDDTVVVGGYQKSKTIYTKCR